MITVGTLAKMYGMLPSHIRDHANTYDIMIANAMISWEQEQADRAAGKTKPAPKISQEQMMEMIKSVRT